VFSNCNLRYVFFSSMSTPHRLIVYLALPDAIVCASFVLVLAHQRAIRSRQLDCLCSLPLSAAKSEPKITEAIAEAFRWYRKFQAQFLPGEVRRCADYRRGRRTPPYLPR
jgi:hypothetical protein